MYEKLKTTEKLINFSNFKPWKLKFKLHWVQLKQFMPHGKLLIFIFITHVDNYQR